MQLMKWFAVPTVVICVAATLTITSWFDSTWVSVPFALSSLASLYLWRRATYRLAGSVENVDYESLASEGQRIFNTIFAVTFTSSLLLMLGALLVLILVPVAQTTSGSTWAVTVMAWCSIVKFGAMNVLAHHLLRTSRPT